MVTSGYRHKCLDHILDRAHRGVKIIEVFLDFGGVILSLTVVSHCLTTD